MTELARGDLVDITIKRVRVRDATHIHVTVEDEHGHIYKMPPQAAIERVAPADWPPQPGDLWREDGTRGLWFVFRDPSAFDASPSGMRAREADGDRWTDDALNLLDTGPLTLIHRDHERPPF